MLLPYLIIMTSALTYGSNVISVNGFVNCLHLSINEKYNYRITNEGKFTISTINREFLGTTRKDVPYFNVC